MKKITVVGGGWAGLAAAAYAARGGAKVRVLEARSELGGRGRTEAIEGFMLNEGAHGLYAGLDGWKVLADLGIAPGGARPARRGYGQLRGKITLMPGTPLDSIRSPMIGLRTKMQLGKILANPAKLSKSVVDGTSMQQWIASNTNDSDARLILAMAARTATYQSNMDQLDARVGVAQTVSAMTDGVRYLDGGWRQIVDALRTCASNAGATFETDAKVSSLAEVDDGDAVILAAGGPRQVVSVLGGRSDVARRWAEEAIPVLAASLDLGMTRLPRPERRFVLGVDSPLYLSVHTPSAKLAPGDSEVVHVLHYDISAGDVRADMEKFLDAAQPGWRAEVVVERFGRSRVVAHAAPLPGRGSLMGRPGSAIPDCAGVFVAGDWVGPTGLLADAALASGRAAAFAALAT